MVRFKAKKMDDLYQGLVGKTPQKLLDMKIFGSIQWSFERGYKGLSRPIYMGVNTTAYAAYIAGKETKKL